MNKRGATRIVRGQHAVDGAGVRLRRVLGNETFLILIRFSCSMGLSTLIPRIISKVSPGIRTEASKQSPTS